MDLSLDLLRTFVLYAETGSIVATARLLGLSQPGVTAQLQRLERELPLPPFVTTGRRKQLTAYGTSLHQALEGELAAVRRALEQVNTRFLDPSLATLRVGARREIIPRLGPLFAFTGRLVVSAHTGDELARRLKSRDLDVVVTQQTLKIPNVLAKELFTDGSKIAVARSLLAKRKLGPKDLTPRKLSGLPALAYRETAPLLAEWLAAAGLSVADADVRVVCEDWMALAAMVERGAGFAILPDGIAVDERLCAVARVPPSVVPESVFHAYFHRDLLEVATLRPLLRSLGKRPAGG